MTPTGRLKLLSIGALVAATLGSMILAPFVWLGAGFNVESIPNVGLGAGMLVCAALGWRHALSGQWRPALVWSLSALAIASGFVGYFAWGMNVLGYFG